jgi:hypothetical protein
MEKPVMNVVSFAIPAMANASLEQAQMSEKVKINSLDFF